MAHERSAAARMDAYLHHTARSASQRPGQDLNDRLDDSFTEHYTSTSNNPHQDCMMNAKLTDPRLTKIFRLEASLGEALDIGNVTQGRRRIVPMTGGTFAGPDLNGTLVAGAS